MNTIKKSLMSFVTVLTIVNLSSCTPLNNRNNDANSSSTPIPSASSKTQLNSTSKSLATTPPTPKTSTDSPFRSEPFIRQKTPRNSSTAVNQTVTVTLYISDDRCQALLRQKISVPAEEPVTAAVGEILKQQDTADFSLSGYRVSINPNNKVATVDLRPITGSRRQLVSLSSCEQFALLGSLRKTLTSNSQWKIKEVRFTERGQAVTL